MNRTAFYAPEAKFAASFAKLVDDLPVVSAISFDTPGAVVERELGIPFAAGMDDITVDTAQFELRAGSRIENATLTTNKKFGDGAVVIDLGTEGRLTEIELTDDSFWPPNPNCRLVVRAATKAGSGYTAGAPLIAEPGFGGGMFGTLLGGMTVTQRKVRFAPIAGTAFIVTWAKGNSATSLDSLPPAEMQTMGVKRVAVEAVPRDASVTLVAGATEVPVWNQPGPLLPGNLQSVSFVPAAERLLREQLATGAPPALAVTLRFRSASVSKLEITSPTLAATYHAEPAGEGVGGAPAPQQLRAAIRGSYERVELDAPATRAPSTTALRVTAKYLGRMLNAAYQETPAHPAISGLRINSERSVAVRAPLQPASLASVRVQLAALQPSEIALELLADATGGPAAALAPHVVRQLAAPFIGWVEIELPAPVPVEAPFVWIALRATKGEVVWCCDVEDGAVARVSDAKLTSWTPADPLLQPRVQLFDAVPPPPEIEIRLQTSLAWTLVQTGPVDYAVPGATLPQPIRALLAAAQNQGGGRSTSVMQLFSRAALDLALADIRLSYTA
ncbi:MAG TPA: hypothetical protein VFP80_12430 [Thermoanaerobaculia bacterium]|nr:hypothetical protein [Thermoanaerobaculia bacterium]